MIDQSAEHWGGPVRLAGVREKCRYSFVVSGVRALDAGAGAVQAERGRRCGQKVVLWPCFSTFVPDSCASCSRPVSSLLPPGAPSSVASPRDFPLRCVVMEAHTGHADNTLTATDRVRSTRASPHSAHAPCAGESGRGAMARDGLNLGSSLATGDPETDTSLSHPGYRPHASPVDADSPPTSSTCACLPALDRRTPQGAQNRT